MAQKPGKKLGILSQFKFTDGTGAAVQFKALQSWEVSISADEVDWSDHDSSGWADTTPSLAKWTATVKGFYFEGDASQVGIVNALLEAITGAGGLLACQFLPEVNPANMAWTGNGRVVDIKHSGTGVKEGQAWDVKITGVGPLTFAAQS